VFVSLNSCFSTCYTSCGPHGHVDYCCPRSDCNGDPPANAAAIGPRRHRLTRRNKLCYCDPSLTDDARKPARGLRLGRMHPGLPARLFRGPGKAAKKGPATSRISTPSHRDGRQAKGRWKSPILWRARGRERTREQLTRTPRARTTPSWPRHVTDHVMVKGASAPCTRYRVHPVGRVALIDSRRHGQPGPGPPCLGPSTSWQPMSG
jgi:hypothetical protein